MANSKPLWQDILKFSRDKRKLAVFFILLGLAGLVLPVIPGLLLLGVGLFLLKPEWFERLKKRWHTDI